MQSEVTTFSALGREGAVCGADAAGAAAVLAGYEPLVGALDGTLLADTLRASAVDKAARLIEDEGFLSLADNVAAHGAVFVALSDGAVVPVTDGALATVRGAGLPDSCWTAVTVAADACVTAEGAAREAFLLAEDGPEWLDGQGLPGRFVGHHGEILESGLWTRLAETGRYVAQH